MQKKKETIDLRRIIQHTITVNSLTFKGKASAFIKQIIRGRHARALKYPVVESSANYICQNKSEDHHKDCENVFVDLCLMSKRSS